MPRSRVRRILSTGPLALALSIPLLPTVSGQTGPRSGVESAPSYPWYLEGVTAALITLVVGGLLLVVAPRYTERVTDRVLEKPGASFLWGLGVLVGVVVLSFVLALTGIGMIVAIPLLLAFVLVAIVAGEFGYLAAGRLAGGNRGVTLLIAVALSAFAGAVPILGYLVALFVSSAGLGAFAIDVLDD